MNRKSLNTLIVDDNDIECEKNSGEMGLDDIKLSKVGFVLSDLEKYDLIVYKGRLGTKVLRLRL